MHDDLLQPSLSKNTIAAAPPSMQAMFLTSFFGGPISAVMMITVASFRLRRLLRDLPVLIALLGASIGIMAWLLGSASTEDFREWLHNDFGNSVFELLYRVISLLCFGVGYWLHARAHRSSSLLGLKAPNGWLVGLPCLVIGYLLMHYILIAFDPTLPFETISR